MPREAVRLTRIPRRPSFGVTPTAIPPSTSGREREKVGSLSRAARRAIDPAVPRPGPGGPQTAGRGAASARLVRSSAIEGTDRLRDPFELPPGQLAVDRE